MNVPQGPESRTETRVPSGKMILPIFAFWIWCLQDNRIFFLFQNIKITALSIPFILDYVHPAPMHHSLPSPTPSHCFFWLKKRRQTAGGENQNLKSGSTSQVCLSLTETWGESLTFSESLFPLWPNRDWEVSSSHGVVTRLKCMAAHFNV